jgi:plastocyanin
VWDTGDMTGGKSTVTTFNTAGTFPFHCIHHGSMGMRGTVIVQQVPGGY